jgi:hypothetical protein
MKNGHFMDGHSSLLFFQVYACQEKLVIPIKIGFKILLPYLKLDDI